MLGARRTSRAGFRVGSVPLDGRVGSPLASDRRRERLASRDIERIRRPTHGLRTARGRPARGDTANGGGARGRRGKRGLFGVFSAKRGELSVSSGGADVERFATHDPSRRRRRIVRRFRGRPRIDRRQKSGRRRLQSRPRRRDRSRDDFSALFLSRFKGFVGDITTNFI